MVKSLNFRNLYFSETLIFIIIILDLPETAVDSEDDEDDEESCPSRDSQFVFFTLILIL